MSCRLAKPTFCSLTSKKRTFPASFLKIKNLWLPTYTWSLIVSNLHISLFHSVTMPGSFMQIINPLRYRLIIGTS